MTRDTFAVLWESKFYFSKNYVWLCVLGATKTMTIGPDYIYFLMSEPSIICNDQLSVVMICLYSVLIVLRYFSDNFAV